MNDALTKALAARLAALAEQADLSATRQEARAAEERWRAMALDNVVGALRNGLRVDADLLLAVAYPPIFAPLFGTKEERPDPLAALVASLGKEPTP